ncbi:hypothetical protein [Paenibacillus motobuensis]|uniref:Tetratricopeptide repeat protein n=1 Tax=Paenibacillus motobuensis TaxID=295324 RepID=A0ABP3ILB7_9BACL
MEDKIFKETISKLIVKRDFFEAERLMLDYIKVNPHDIDGWSRLVILETLSPIEDYERATDYLTTALTYHRDNHLFFIVRLFFIEWYLGGLNETLIKMALGLKNSMDYEMSSMLSYILAWHYKNKDIYKFESLLEQSIQEYSKHVTNYADLGKFYLNKGEKEQGTELIKKGIANIKVIYRDSNNDHDPLDIIRFINERITGVFITEGTYHSLENLIQTSD